ncbi:DUF4105 domain-containing protein [Dysgonomonas sp. BGC7]|uniref:lipoprotein N-acyltransferase Lnb domain-containing protein n=1 Tax=Dysgonomonas sp. BGC7 TaxID=1658008 RepID=UPI000680B6EA|nr:DUF4105 domain-containing protein [Dysgonomonas sp. BGC7]MBD8388609.1 DUF4105 domain-containing protein [Dysgonomonas sp. BGC7]
MRRLIFLILIFIGFSNISKAENDNRFDQTIILSDTSQISLLTSNPWEGAIYALFGHTAIRIKDPVKNIDIVYNYGIFNFNAPNFILRFVKGETDYMVASVPYQYYIEEYRERGVGVIEQVFNLTQKEKQEILNALFINAMPENRIYRYNYFYDNCSTRPRDIIAKYVDGTIKYAPTDKIQTYRDLVRECTNIQPWSRFGIDLVIGAEADKTITDRQKDFLPLYLLNAYTGAVVENTDGEKRELVNSENVLLTTQGTPTLQSSIDQPLLIGSLLLVFIILISVLIYRKKIFTLSKVFDTILFLVAGLSGCIIFFLMFFSEHPCTNPNWNIVWLNPLQLIVAILFFVKSLSKYLYYYHFINFVALLAFLLAWSLIPQQLEIAFIPYILSIVVRSGMNILQYKKLNKKAVYSLPRAK